MKTKLSIMPGVVALLAVGCSFAQSAGDHPHPHRSFLEQSESPLTAVSQDGSALVLKNESDKRIVSYVLGCFSRKGKRYIPIQKFDASRVPVEPGAFTSEGGFDATPLNICRSQNSLVGVISVRFSDESSWLSPWKK